MKTLSLAFATAAVATLAQAKNNYIVKEDVMQKEHKRPKVETTTEKCAYDAESFRLCGQYGANIQIGWEWEQEYYDLSDAEKYYNLKLSFYAQQGVDLEGLFFMDRMYSNETAITLEDFKYLFTIEMNHWYENGRTCLAVLQAIDDLVFEIEMKQKMIEAQKNIIEHLWTLDNWDSPWALWLDDFGLSDSTPITLFKREITQDTAERIFWGVTEDVHTGCSPGYLFTGSSSSNNPSSKADIHPIDRWLTGKLENLFDYFYANYKHQGGSQLY